MTVLATPRLLLGPFREDDAEPLNRWENDVEVLLSTPLEAAETPSLDVEAPWPPPMNR